MKVFPIKHNSSRVAVVAFGIFAIIGGLIFQGISWGNPNKLFISEFLLGFLIIVISLIGYTEIGLKLILPPKFSRLKRLGTQQIVTLVITTIVLFTGISLMSGFSLGFLSSFAGGNLIVQGIIVIIEAFR